MDSQPIIKEPTMNQTVFFSFSSKFVGSTFQASPVDQKIDHLRLIKGDYIGIDFPIIFQQTGGHKLLDILDTGYVSLFLISDRLKFILEENRLTGWKTFPIILYDKKNNQIFGYQGFSVTGRCGSTHFEKSKIIEKQLVPTGPVCKYYRGIFIDRWDGTDFFSPEKKYHTFVTNKASDLLKKNKITNLRLENSDDYETAIRHVISENLP